MARTQGQIIAEILGEKDFRLADLQAKLEDMTEKATALQKALDDMPAKAESRPTRQLKEATG